MSIIDDIKNQFKGENNISDSSLPWTFDNAKNNDNNVATKKFDTKKIATLGLILLVVLIVMIALFNFFSGNNSVSVEASEQSSEEITSEIKVHIAGEVKKPNLYTLKDGSRIYDAVDAAGGFTDNADRDSLNLAKVLEDGEQIVVPARGGGAAEASASSSAQNNGKVNINTADLATLQTLSGVGPSTAQKIIDYRNANGKFKSIDDLKKISGIGEKTFEKFKDKICV